MFAPLTVSFRAECERYFEKNMPEALGDLPAGLLFDFLVEEIGPLIYNCAIADAQARLAVRLSDLSGKLWADEFQYWSCTVSPFHSCHPERSISRLYREMCSRRICVWDCRSGEQTADPSTARWRASLRMTPFGRAGGHRVDQLSV